jgi:hypothetical protein
MTKLEKTVSAARKQLRSGNRIEAISAVRTAYPETGLKGAKHFVDWLEMQTLSISAAAANWCVEHWLPFDFDQPEGHYNAAHAGREGYALNSAVDGAMQPSQQLSALEAAGYFSDGEKPKAPSQPVKCKCGNPFCADQWHRLARWIEADPLGNGRRLSAWLKAMCEEDPETDSTFEAAPGLSLVWSSAKGEQKEEIAESQDA